MARLGHGGMGQVFFGHSPGGRPVAVKLIRPDYAADAEFRRRFRQEVEAAGRVGGFHTAPVVDAGPDAPIPWLVTAYVPGPSLATAVTEHGPLPPHSARILGAGLAEALEAIHAAGLVHRDLKPSNILLADDGPRVIDFGIARAVDASGVTGRVGTPAFMSPEQVTGAEITPQSDVFSFGLVLAYAAGVRPFGAGPAEALPYRIVRQDPDLTRLDPSLQSLVASCLAKDPRQRPAPGQLLAELTGPAAARGGWLPPTVQTMIDRYAPPFAPNAQTRRLPDGPSTQVAGTPPAKPLPLAAALVRYRVLAMAIGVLLVLLLGGVGLASFAHDPTMIRSLGPLQGLAFLGYLAAAFDLWRRARWSTTRLFVMIFGGLVPFATFAVERWVTRAARGLAAG
ncbi:MAG TPA: protein kinase [Streptosporangiaceae bacterium]